MLLPHFRPCGRNFLVTTLTDYITAWISLFCHSCKAKIAWKEQTQIAMKTHSATRWWSKFEIIKQVFDLLGDVETFLRHDYLAPAKLLAFFDDPRKKVYLELELATLVDAALPFVQATYNDGPLVFDCYDTISSLTTAINVAHYPIVEAVSQRIVQAHSYSKQQLLAYSKQCIQPAYQYYTDRIYGCLKEPLAAFKAACLFVPQRIQELQPDANTIDSLVAFPFLNNPTVLDHLKQELPKYITLTEDLSSEYNALLWWKSKGSALPTWASCVKKVLCIQPSSAAAEREYSLYCKHPLVIAKV